MASTAGVTGPLRWAVRSEALEGELVSGDRHVVVPTDDGGALVAVIDGLGHGRDAAIAAAEAARVLEGGPARSVLEALAACHVALTRTRGAVMSVARVAGGELTWAGVGNVEGLLVRGAKSAEARARLFLAAGVVGSSSSHPRVSRTAVARGDLLVFATDGLRSDVMEHVDPLAAPGAVVDRLMRECRTGRDDALAFAARYDGPTR